MPTKKKEQRSVYRPPAVTHRGRLTQFAGSPFGKTLSDPLDLPPR